MVGQKERKTCQKKQDHNYWDFTTEIHVAEELPFKSYYSKSTAARNADKDTHQSPTYEHE